MAKSTILVVDDERDILELIRYNLEKENYRVIPAVSGEEALSRARQNKPDLVVLDLMLPGIDGLDVCRILKTDKETQTIPIIMVTAKGEEADVVSGLELGAADYVCKPFSPRVLVARVRACLREQTTRDEMPREVIKYHDLFVDPVRHQARIGEQPLDLTVTEFRILQFLARRPGWVFSRTQIINSVHGESYAVTERAVDVQIVGLRKKLGEYGELIETVRGVGYRFKEL